MSHAAQSQQHPGANGGAHHAQATHGAEQNDHEQTDKSGGHNDSMLQIANIFMSKTASIAFLELQGANGRKFHFNENVMKQILLPDHSTQNQNTASYASNLLKRIHLQKHTTRYKQCLPVPSWPAHSRHCTQRILNHR